MNPAYLSPLANHLWQSTLFAAIAGLLTLALRDNRAQVRHGVWLAASWKFLIPFSVLISLGGHIQWRAAPAATQPNFALALDRASQPFTAPVISSPLSPALPSAQNPLPMVLLIVWAFGVIGIACSWWIRWRRIRGAVRVGTPVQLDIPIRAISSPALLEPGVFGVFRPVLLLPNGIFERLTAAQWRAVIAHELCHVRRRDNLVAVIQMFVETVFWFHPLVWWIGNRMVEERERACDEEVLLLTGEARTYAEGILNICKLYVESPLAGVSGVTGGANLKKRIEEIMKNRISLRLNFGKKLLLAAVGMLVASAPLIVGLAKTQTTATPAFEVASLKQVPDKEAVPLSILPRRTPGRFAWNTALGRLMCYAYHLPLWRISGIDTKAPIFYTIAATMDANATEDQVRLMLRALLIDRFKIVSHKETRQLPGYALIVGKNGSKLKTASASGEAPPMPDFFNPPPAAWEGRIFTSMPGVGISAIVGRRVSTSQLADELSEDLDAFVWDQTGMTGKYYFGFKFLSVQHPSDTADAPSIFSVLQDELGLRLEKQKGPVEILVVDHYEKPSEN